MFVDDYSDESVDSAGDRDIGTSTPVWIITVVLCVRVIREQCSHRGLIYSGISSLVTNIDIDFSSFNTEK